MAKAKDISGLDCASDALERAAEVLLARFDEIISLRDSALDFSDIEGVHDMRVATRRLRSALRDFAPLMKKRPSKKARNDLKRLADALGAVRDQDVAIEALEKLQTEVEIASIREGIENLLKERRDLRQTARLDLTETLAAGKLDDLEERFTTAIDRAARRKKHVKFISFNEAGRAAIAAGLEHLFDLGTSVYDPLNAEKLHETRIAAKRLRYAIELFIACWGDEIAPFAEEIAAMQSFLGEIHDGDLWIEDLGARLRHEPKNAADESVYQARVWLLSEFAKRRTKDYRAALKLWSEWQTNDFAGRMRAAIQNS